jgi:hypothetical protein
MPPVEDTEAAPENFDALGEAFTSFIDKGFEPESVDEEGEPSPPSDEAPKDTRQEESKDQPSDDSDEDIPEEDEEDEPEEDTADSDDDEDETPDDDEDEDDEDDLVIAADEAIAKVNGVKIPVSELKKGYLRQQDYTAKTEEVAKRRKDVEAAEAVAVETKQQLGSINATLLGYLASILPEEPNPLLYREDPTAYNDQKIQREAVLNRMQQVKGQLDQLTSQETGKLQQSRQEAMQKSGAALAEARPFLRDPEKRTQYFGNLVAGGERYYGLTKEEVMSTTDHRLFLALEDAVRYRKLKGKAPKAKRDTKAKPALKPRGRRSRKQNAITNAEQQIGRAAKSGRIEDAAGVLGDLLLAEGR